MKSRQPCCEKICKPIRLSRNNKHEETNIRMFSDRFVPPEKNKGCCHGFVQSFTKTRALRDVKPPSIVLEVLFCKENGKSLLGQWLKCLLVYHHKSTQSIFRLIKVTAVLKLPQLKIQKVYRITAWNEIIIK